MADSTATVILKNEGTQANEDGEDNTSKLKDTRQQKYFPRYCSPTS